MLLFGHDCNLEIITCHEIFKYQCSNLLIPFKSQFCPSPNGECSSNIYHVYCAAECKTAHIIPGRIILNKFAIL